jgi:hypothetical protein
MHDLIYAPRWNANVLGQTILTDTHGREKVFEKHFSWVYRRKLLGRHRTLLVIIDDLDVIGVSLPPLETDSPLIIDSDAMLSSSSSTQPLKAVSGRNSEVPEASRRIQNPELAKRNSLNILSQLPNRLALK